MSNSEELELAKEVARKAKELAKEKEAKLLSSIRAEFYVQLSEVLKSGSVKAATWHVGDGRPAIDFGNANDFYLNSTNGDIFFNDFGTWGQILNIKGRDGIDGLDGAKGEKGDRGATGLAGDRGKDGKDGKDGRNGKDGRDGKDGKNGKDGKDGEDGSKWYTGRGLPAYNLGEVGDFYLQDNGNFFEKTQSIEWTKRGSLRGPAGADGFGGGGGGSGSGSGIVETIVAGANISVDDTDPANPIISSSGGSGIVESVVSGNGVSVDDTDPANPQVSLNFSEFNTDDIDEGSFNLYSQWSTLNETNKDNITPSDGQRLLIGSQANSTYFDTNFSAATAIFDGTATDGTAYFLNFAYGSSLISVGAAFGGGRARGSASAPTQTQANDSLMSILPFARDNSGNWVLHNDGAHILSGIYFQAKEAPTSSNFDLDIFIGSITSSLLTAKLRGLTGNSIVVNESAVDTDFIVNSDTNEVFRTDGSTNQLLLGNGSAGTPILAFLNSTGLGLHRVGADHASLNAGGVSRLQWNTSEVVVNPGGLASGDFRVLGDVLTHLFFVDVSSQQVGVGTNAPILDFDIEFDHAASTTGLRIANSNTGGSGITELRLDYGASQRSTFKFDRATLTTLLGGVAGSTKIIANNNTAITIDSSTLVSTFAADVVVPDEAYGVGWNGSLEVPTKNAIYDKIETLSGGGSPAGISGAVQFNDGGVFGGADYFTVSPTAISAILQADTSTIGFEAYNLAGTSGASIQVAGGGTLSLYASTDNYAFGAVDGTYQATLISSLLTANQNYYLPDATGTIVVDTNVNEHKFLITNAV